MRKLPVVISFFACCAFAACEQGTTQAIQSAAQSQAPHKLGVAAYEQELAATTQAQLIDVRTLSEFKEGHIRGATNIDVRTESFGTQVARLDKTRPVFVYCQSGRRSSAAAARLVAMGFRQVYNLEGGIQSWTNAGKSVEQ